MYESDERTGIQTISKIIGQPISVKGEGVMIGERRFESAIAVIGGGTGLEALQYAQTFSDSAVFIIDPSTSAFAGKIYDQLVTSDVDSIDWSFFTDNPNLARANPILASALFHKTKKIQRIDDEFKKYKGSIKELRDRIFFVNEPTFNVKPDAPMFRHVQVTYPETDLDDLPSFYTFIKQGLRPGGTCQFVTDIDQFFYNLLGFQYRAVSEHGRLTRKGGVQNVRSVYDILNGDSGFYYVDFNGERLLSEPGLLMMFLYPWSLLGLSRATFGKKRRDIEE